MNELNGYDYEDLEPGMKASFAKTITEADIVLFAGASGDNNAVHINEESNPDEEPLRDQNHGREGRRDAAAAPDPLAALTRVVGQVKVPGIDE